MKKVILAVMLLMVLAVPCFAEDVKITYAGTPIDLSDYDVTATVHDPVQEVYNKSGLKLNAYNLIGVPQISKDLFIGFEGGKDIAYDVFRDSFSYEEADRGYFGYMVVSYNKCLINCGR